MTKAIAELPPVLTTRRALWLADCSRSTLERSGIKPLGRRGKTLVWETRAVLDWMSGKPVNGNTAG